MHALAAICVFALGLTVAVAEDATSVDGNPKQPDKLTYDYETLRKWGLSLAFIFFVAGLLIVFSKHCRCRFPQDRHRGDRSDSLIPAQSTA
ncbi:sodium/potassium-transporting ATPase subunit gamma-like [Petromyzon marinus]|uniref:sodium/potassium-transporting ATPase subunit gamma-like n=1 Tax=Petromyzon marinus TaxID=7757 RepID=UPI003F721808